MTPVVIRHIPFQVSPVLLTFIPFQVLSILSVPGKVDLVFLGNTKVFVVVICVTVCFGFC